MRTLDLRWRLVLLVLPAAVLLAACGRQESSDNPRPTTSSADRSQAEDGSGAVEVRDKAQNEADAASLASRDAAISARVQSRLAQDGRLGALDIQVETIEGRVQLRGMTPDTAARSHAAQLTQAVTGVVAVRNDLSVQVLNR